MNTHPNDLFRSYANVTKEFIINSLMEFWALEVPENYFHSRAADFFPIVKNNPLKRELAVEIANLPRFELFIQRLFEKCVTGSDDCVCVLDSDDVWRFAKIAIKNIADYESRRNEVRKTVNKLIREEKSKVTKNRITEIKKILKEAGFKVTK